jgi:hypothetical protein
MPQIAVEHQSGADEQQYHCPHHTFLHSHFSQATMAPRDLRHHSMVAPADIPVVGHAGQPIIRGPV